MKALPKKIPSLDGLRALAVIAVMLVHIGFPGFVLGGLGVDLFFALSGFLITHLFIEEKARSGEINLRKFWVRRFLRLMPVYLLYVVFITLLIVYGVGEIKAHGGWSPLQYVLSMWLYFINYLPFGGIWTEQSLTIHLWSLAIEEQFYVFWPLVIVLLFYFRLLFKASIVLLLIFSIYYLFYSSDFERLSAITGRGLTLFLGCFFAFSIFSADIVFSILLACVVMLTVFVYFGLYDYHEVLRGYSVAVGALCCWLIASLRCQSSTLTHRLLETPWLISIGKISYGIYLYHMLVQKLVWEMIFAADLFGGPIDYALRIVCYFSITFLLASCSFYFFESYFLKLKETFGQNVKTLNP